MTTLLRNAFSRHPAQRHVPDDGTVIAVLAAVIGAIRVVIALVQHESFGAEATIGLGLLVLGIIGVALSLRRR
jgi:hypothetical protein